MIWLQRLSHLRLWQRRAEPGSSAFVAPRLDSHQEPSENKGLYFYTRPQFGSRGRRSWHLKRVQPTTAGAQRVALVLELCRLCQEEDNHLGDFTHGFGQIGFPFPPLFFELNSKKSSLTETRGLYHKTGFLLREVIQV